jgi:hypothetical protein
MRRGAGRNLAIVAVTAAAVTLSACGSGAPQDAKAPSGNFPVSITRTSFPTKQRLAQTTRLTIVVHNTGTKTIPNVAVTICNGTCVYPAPVGQGTSVQAFAHYLNMPGLAYHSRPVWIVDKPPGPCPPKAPANGTGYSCSQGGPGGFFTVDANTWAYNAPLLPGGDAKFTWDVTAVVPGTFTVAWQVAAGIYGKAKAVLSDGSMPHGAFKVTIARPPAQSHVNDNGQIVPGA